MYQVIVQNTIRRLSDGAFIPTDPQNSDYIAYLAWVEESANTDAQESEQT